MISLGSASNNQQIERERQGKGDLFGGGVVAIVTEMITGIIVNDYRNNLRSRNDHRNNRERLPE